MFIWPRTRQRAIAAMLVLFIVPAGVDPSPSKPSMSLRNPSPSQELRLRRIALELGGRDSLKLADSLFSCFGQVSESSPISALPENAAFLDSSLGSDTLWREGLHPAGAVGPLGRFEQDYVYALTLHADELVVAGEFGFLDGVRVPGIGSWNGSRWQPLGSKILFPRGTNCLAEYKGDLVAGGTIWAADGDAGSCVLRWNGSEWQPFGDGLRGTGYRSTLALQQFGPDLVAAGAFEDAEDGARTIARWDGTAWHAMGADSLRGENLHVRALEVLNDSLYIGGWFTLSAGAIMGNVARWTGSGWELVGGGTDGRVEALGVYRGLLVAAGNFTRAGTAATRNIASWDGRSWRSLGRGIAQADNPIVTSLRTLGDDLVAAGRFDSAGTVAANSIASWNGSTWSAIVATGAGCRLPHYSAHPYHAA